MILGTMAVIGFYMLARELLIQYRQSIADAKRYGIAYEKYRQKQARARMPESNAKFTRRDEADTRYIKVLDTAIIEGKIGGRL